MEIPLGVGDGFVFDAGEDRNEEQGGTVWKVDGRRLFFDRRSGIDWGKVVVGRELWKTSDPKLEREVKRSWKSGRLEEKGEVLDLVVKGRVGERLVVECRGKRVESEVDLEKAERRPLNDEVLVSQLGRLGGTGFSLGEVDNLLEGEVMMPLGELNRLRRRLVEELRDERVVRDGQLALVGLSPEVKEVERGEVKLRVLCRSMDQLRGVVNEGVGRVYCDFEDLREYREAVEMARAGGAEVFLATPRIQKPREVGFFKLVEKAGADGVLVRNLGGISYFRERGIPVVGDFSLNVANPVTARLLMEYGGFEYLTISYDLNERQVEELLRGAPADWFELTVHQHMPMFHMEHCVFCTFLSNGGTSIKDCGKPCDRHSVRLRDRVGQEHILKADVGCRNTLFNGRAQTGVGSVDEFLGLGLENYRVELLEESGKEGARLVRWYREFFEGKGEPSDLVRKLGAVERLGVTRGTLEQRRNEVH